MSINHTILGMLNCKPSTGYDLKKIMQETSFMPWSGNNNQIYKALLELDDNAFVTSELYPQDGSPSKKVYTITEAGLSELKKWLQSAPEMFEVKKPILLQLAWANLLSDEELDELLEKYEQELRGQMFIEQTKSQSGFFNQGRTSRESAIWDLINQNILLSYQSELEWVGRARGGLFHHNNPKKATGALLAKEHKKMEYKIIEKDNQKYILLEPVGEPVQTEQDALWLFTICLENQISHLLIHGERLSDDFLRLRTGIAGIALQKFSTYGIKAAAILDEERTKGKFKEFLMESNKGNIFRSFPTFKEAEHWLLDKNNERQKGK